MKNYYLAIDIGASSGRHILGHIEKEKIHIEEIYRFENKIIKDRNNLCWDIPYLFKEIINGMKICGHLGKTPVSMGIDTWAVDYVLLDKNDKILGKTFSYRDCRTDGTDRTLEKLISLQNLYKRTGIQKQMFNTIYQLIATERDFPELFRKAETFMMLPDYFNFLLTGIKKSEYTNATSTQLVNLSDKNWDKYLIKILGFNENIFLPLNLPGTYIGKLKKEIVNETGFNCKVIMPASHDTASAVISISETEEKSSSIYISSGTWSLIGIETENPVCTDESMRLNFSNEGGYNYKFRFLKNVMGLWIIQSVKKETDNLFSFEELCSMAEDKRDFPSRINVNDIRFLSPKNMIEEIKAYCAETGQAVPETVDEISSVVYHSLADAYSKTVREIEKISNRKYSRIHIIGGGSNARYLNQLTADKTGKTVYSGPSESSSLGNLIVQMIQDKVFQNSEEARKVIHNSFEIKKYIPCKS